MRRALLPALLATGLLAPAAAQAEDIYVSASSTREESFCPVLRPCTLNAGIVAADQAGDVVHVRGGVYTPTTPLDHVRPGVTVVGAPGDRPVIHDVALTTLDATAQAPTRIEHLEIVNTVDLRRNVQGTDLVVRDTALGVRLTGGTLRQSLVVVEGDQARGVLAYAGNVSVSESTVMAGGTGARAIAAEPYSYYDYSCDGEDVSLDVRNVIARGTDFDLTAVGDDGQDENGPNAQCSSTASVAISHSNFRTTEVVGTVTAPASVTPGAGNQTTPELTDFAAIFADTTLYRQKDTAPTRDAGAGAEPAPTDVDGQARVQEGAIDIGVDELPAPPLVASAEAVDAGQTTATLRALVTPNASETRVVFDYGPTDAYGSSTPPQVLSAGTAATTVQARLEGLAAGTTFHYRVRALNPEDVVQPQSATSSDATFATRTAPPQVVVTHPPLPDVLTGLTAKKSLKLATFNKKGLRLAFTLGRPGTAYAVRLTARMRVKGKLRVVTLAKARGTAGPGARLVTLKPSRRTVALLRKVRRLKAKLVVTAAPGGVASRTVTLKR